MQIKHLASETPGAFPAPPLAGAPLRAAVASVPGLGSLSFVSVVSLFLFSCKLSYVLIVFLRFIYPLRNL